MNEEERKNRRAELYEEINQAIDAFIEKSFAGEEYEDDEEFKEDIRCCLWEGATIASKLICHKTKWIDKQEDDPADWWKG